MGLKSFTLVWFSLPSEARNHQVTWTNKCPSKNKQTKSRERWCIMVYIFYFETLQLEIWHAYSYNIVLVYETWRLYILHKLFCIKVGSVFSKVRPLSLYIWYHTVWTQNGLNPLWLSTPFTKSAIITAWFG